MARSSLSSIRVLLRSYLLEYLPQNAFVTSSEDIRTSISVFFGMAEYSISFHSGSSNFGRMPSASIESSAPRAGKLHRKCRMMRRSTEGVGFISLLELVPIAAARIMSVSLRHLLAGIAAPRTFRCAYCQHAVINEPVPRQLPMIGAAIFLGVRRHVYDRA